MRASSEMMTRMYWHLGVELDVQQLLDRVVPGHLVHRRADIVLAVDHRHVLVEVQVFAQLLEARVQIADVRCGLDDPFTVQLEISRNVV